jgi:hypothetical protein
MDNMSIRLEIEEIKKKLNSQDKNIELVFSSSMNLSRSMTIKKISRLKDLSRPEKINNNYRIPKKLSI